MNNKIISANHFSVTSSNDVKQICAPVFKKLSLSAFVYARVYRNGQSWSLVNCPEYHIEHVNQRFLVLPQKILDTTKNQFFFLNYDEKRKNELLRKTIDCQRQLGYFNPFYVISQQQEFMDLMVFGTSSELLDPINHYLSIQEALEKFKFYFRDKADKLIRESKNHMFRLDKKSLEIPGNILNSRIDGSTLQLDFKHYHFDCQNRSYVITRKEYKVVSYLMKGYSYKMIADKLQQSPRTIEKYVDSVRIKTECVSKNHLIKFLTQSDLLPELNFDGDK